MDDGQPDAMKKAAEWLKGSSSTVALTGAGMSVESGIPDFRGEDGLWTRYDPMEYGYIDLLYEDPGKAWIMIKELLDTVNAAGPNPAHTALAQLEGMGKLEAVITQNIDGLHQAGGSKEVIEFHGSCRELTCLNTGCRQGYAPEVYLEDCPPHCRRCGTVLRPEFIFFGEPIPEEAVRRSLLLASRCEVMLVIGTSATVTPAALLPRSAMQGGARVIEVNKEFTLLSPTVDITLTGEAGTVLPALIDLMR